jgi:predicted TIM-barrel fold metal-dependent hydrolase
MYNGTKVLDVHGHVSVPQVSNLFGWNLMSSNTAATSPLVTGRGAVGETEYREAAARHIAYIDERQIDVQLIGPRPFIMFGNYMQPHLLPKWTEHVNLTIAQQVKFHPDRFLGAGQLSQNAHERDTTHVIDELNHCVEDLGFPAIYASPDPSGDRATPGMDKPYWYPLYERCVELNVPIIIHGTNCNDHRIGVVPQNYQIGFATEQYIATQVLGHSDVFERYPELKIIVCHLGGALDRFIRSDHHLSQKNLVNNLFFDTCAHDIPYLEAGIKQRGIPQIVFGTEAPGSGAAVRPDSEPGITGDDLVPVIGAIEWLTDDEKADIFNRNPARVVPALGRI